MTEDELLEILLLNLDNLQCYNCGESAAKSLERNVIGDDALLGCLHFNTSDESVNESESVYWVCPGCEKESTKTTNLIVELSNLNEGSMRTIKRELKVLVEDYGYRKMVSGCINIKEGK